MHPHASRAEALPEIAEEESVYGKRLYDAYTSERKTTNEIETELKDSHATIRELRTEIDILKQGNDTAQKDVNSVEKPTSRIMLDYFFKGNPTKTTVLLADLRLLS